MTVDAASSAEKSEEPAPGTEPAEEPWMPSEVAVIVAEPLPMPVTVLVAPGVVAVAVAGEEEDHVTVRPVRVLPEASRTVAVSVCVPPIATENVEGETVTEATGTAVTVAAEVPVTVSQVAVIVEEPTATAVTVAV